MQIDNNKNKLCYHQTCIKQPPSGYWQVNLMEVGCSIDVQHILAQYLSETSLYFETSMQWRQHDWSTVGCIFLHHILKINSNRVYQVLGSWPHGFLIEVTTMGELLLGRQKGGSSRLIEVQFTIPFYNHFSTWITDCSTESGHLK